MNNRHSTDFTTEHARVMEVMDCVAGHAEAPDGLPATIIKLAHQGELEQPMLISLRDTKCLLLHLVGVLAEHGDVFAKELTTRYFTIQMSIKSPPPPRSHSVRPKTPVTLVYPAPAENFVVNEPLDQITKLPAIARLKPTAASNNWKARLAGSSAMNVKFTVKYGQGRLKNKFYLFGAYNIDDSIYILARRRTSGGGVQDGILKLLPNQQVELHPPAATLLPPERWANFLHLRGSEFRLDAGVCHKLADAEAKALVADRIFRCA